MVKAGTTGFMVTPFGDRYEAKIMQKVRDDQEVVMWRRSAESAPVIDVLDATTMALSDGSRFVSHKQNACRRCGGFGTIPHREMYHADTKQIPCPDCQTVPAVGDLDGPVPNHTDPSKRGFQPK